MSVIILLPPPSVTDLSERGICRYSEMLRNTPVIFFVVQLVQVEVISSADDRESPRGKGACVSHCRRPDPRARPAWSPVIASVRDTLCAPANALARVFSSSKRTARRSRPHVRRGRNTLAYVCASTRASAHVADSDRVHWAVGEARQRRRRSTRVAVSRARHRARGLPPRPMCCP